MAVDLAAGVRQRTLSLRPSCVDTVSGGVDAQRSAKVVGKGGLLTRGFGRYL
jgi:hypothetical protein